MIAPPLRATLTGLAARMAATAREPWWIVTGAAAALHGAATDVGDVDLLVGIDDARRLLGPAAAAGPPSGRYRSRLFGRLSGWPLPVEVMADWEIRVAGEWRRVRFATREAVMLDGAALPVPSRAELSDLLLALGRPKDLARHALLAAAGP